ncbi:MAG: hypothetical protein AAGH76_15035 [Pseudomonadota bacterium]
MDILNEAEAFVMTDIAAGNDHPLLMMNLNRYAEGAFPDGALYREWRQVNAAMISEVGGKILWTLPVHGHILANGPVQPLDEILAYWYPSHQSFLAMRGSESGKRNFEIRQTLIEHAIVHRCDGERPPVRP